MPKEYKSTKQIRANERKRKQIWEALHTLLSDKHIDSISVQDICDVAMIHRTTFYNHFYDVYDLLEYGALLLLDQVFPEDDIHTFDIEDLSENIIQFVVSYRTVFSNICRAPRHEQMKQATQNTFERYMLRILRNNPNYTEAAVPLEAMVKYHCGGLANLLFWWFDNPQIPMDKIQTQIRFILAYVEKSFA